ncbi:MAG: hypothetical protein DRJ31_03790 [Candidatus Methanomethylicota archaeon]|uniref:tRNA-t(6)A37 methylthiotransferase n=1 Tax=Thermoproteota archaeon TaxID=2056631 RepID=A0A497F0C5_9CREN|nr:MAG: hypothetical protein DRJ31_03790 [Candidatus Verstraetearchaeota archaeon]RLE52769.1 MAG: hypothetical protein DRJ33_02830 [Candidatus Verstraetearchaeota archaeon]
MKAYMETYGCAANVVDTNVVKGFLKEAGIELAQSPAEADVLIINTCTVRDETDIRICKRLNELKALYRRGKKVIVMGCLAAAQPALVKELMPNASIITPDTLDQIIAAVKSPSKYVATRPQERRVYIPKHTGEVIYTISVSRGCLGNCAYCIVKRARGDLVSADMDEVVKAVKDAVKSGAKEIRLTSQDLAVYGLDKGFTLVDLLKKISREVDGKFKIRLGMMNPNSLAPILDDVLNMMSSDERFYRFFHIPVQSGDDEVLKMMRRKYNVSLFKHVVWKIRKQLPDASIATDIIVGFPGESEEAFRHTLQLIDEVKPDKVHVARYTPRPHTPAAKLKQIPDSVKKSRSELLMRKVEEVTLERNLALVGKVVNILLVEKKGEGIIGRMDNYKPVVVLDPQLKPGDEVPVVIDKAKSIYLMGRLVSLTKQSLPYAECLPTKASS